MFIYHLNFVNYISHSDVWGLCLRNGESMKDQARTKYVRETLRTT